MSQHGARLVLSALARNDGASQREIVEVTHLRPPTVSVILRKMQDEGIVELVKNPEDKRSAKNTGFYPATMQKNVPLIHVLV